MKWRGSKQTSNRKISVDYECFTLILLHMCKILLFRVITNMVMNEFLAALWTVRWNQAPALYLSGIDKVSMTHYCREAEGIALSSLQMKKTVNTLLWCHTGKQRKQSLWELWDCVCGVTESAGKKSYVHFWSALTLRAATDGWMGFPLYCLLTVGNVFIQHMIKWSFLWQNNKENDDKLDWSYLRIGCIRVRVFEFLV